MLRRKNDILWKGMLEVVFDDLLRFVFPDADQLFDLKQKVEFLDKELTELNPQPDKKPDTRFVDKLVKVHQKNGSDQWILCHIEVQERYDPAFAKRMFKYYCRVFDRYDHPVTGIAIFTGRGGKRFPGIYKQRYAGSELVYKYNTLRILDYEDKMLAASNNPFALIVLAAKKALLKGKDLDEVLLKEKLSIAGILIKKGFSPRKTKAVLSFLSNYIRFAQVETSITYKNQLDHLTKKSNTMDIFEQVKQMEIEEATKATRKIEKTKIVKRLLARHFPITEIAKIAGVSVAFIEKLKKPAQ